MGKDNYPRQHDLLYGESPYLKTPTPATRPLIIGGSIFIHLFGFCFSSSLGNGLFIFLFGDKRCQQHKVLVGRSRAPRKGCFIAPYSSCFFLMDVIGGPADVEPTSNVSQALRDRVNDGLRHQNGPSSRCHSRT